MVYFISGHRNISKENFEKYYLPKIKRVINNDPDPYFIVGDYEGTDYMAQQYLVSLGMTGKTTVYHMFEKPRNYVEGLKCIGGFKSDEERDSAMTRDSDFDIAFYEKKRGWSGTFTNIARRWGLLILFLTLVACGEYSMTQTFKIEVQFLEGEELRDTSFIVFPPSNFTKAPEVIEHSDGTIIVSYVNRYTEGAQVLNEGPILGKGKLVSFKSMKHKILDIPSDEKYWTKCYNP